MSIASHKELDVWKLSMDCIKPVYDIVWKLPKEERFALADQIRRAVISIPSNIAEGSRRGTLADYRHFCRIALGSASELETQLLAVQRLYPEIILEYVLSDILRVEQMLIKLIQRLR